MNLTDSVSTDRAILSYCRPFLDAIETISVMALDATESILANGKADGALYLAGLASGDHVRLY
jgi:hypothetical protein